MTRVKKSVKGPRWTPPREREVPTWPMDTEAMVHIALSLMRDLGGG